MATRDSELIHKARQGDLNAFEQLVFRYDKEVLTIAARFVNNADDAKDIYQEVFLRVYQGLRKFQLRSEFSTWLYRITTNVCLTHKTRRKRHAHVALNDDREESESDPHGLDGRASTDASPHQQAVESELEGKITSALETLSPQQKLIFTLKHYQGYTLSEIAMMLNCSGGTVKKHLFVATRRLREQLKEYY